MIYVKDREQLLLEFIKDAATLENIEFDGYIENPDRYMTVSDEQYNKIATLLKNSKDGISLNSFLWINSLLAYGESNENILKEIKKYIIKNQKVIYESLEVLKLEDALLDSKNKQYYQSMINSTLSYEYILDLTTLNSYHHQIYKKNRLWGVEYLLINLFRYTNNSFNEWFLSTKQTNQKLIFCEAVLSPMYHNGLFTIENSKSNILFIRLFSKIQFYNINENYLHTEKSFRDLEENHENALLTLYHFYKKSLKSEDELYINKLKNDIESSKDIINLLTQDDFSGSFKYTDTTIMYELISLLKNEPARKVVYENYAKFLIEKIEKEKYISSSSIELANILGNILYQVDKKVFEQFENDFNTKLDALSEPYYFYRFWSLWSKRISESCLYLISIFIYYNLQNKDDFKKHKSKFIKIKKDFYHVNDDKIEDIVKQIL